MPFQPATTLEEANRRLAATFQPAPTLDEANKRLADIEATALNEAANQLAETTLIELDGNAEAQVNALDEQMAIREEYSTKLQKLKTTYHVDLNIPPAKKVDLEEWYKRKMTALHNKLTNA